MRRVPRRRVRLGDPTVTPIEAVAFIFIGGVVTMAVFIGVGMVAVLLRWVVRRR